jgi:hypothetical protein
MKRIPGTTALCVLSFTILTCDTSTPLLQVQTSVFDIIEHSLLHMADPTGVVIPADTVLPGTHMEPEDFDHKRLEVVLQPINGGNGGYIHFGPHCTGDFLVMTDCELPVSFTNRHVEGDVAVDVPLEIERTFGAKEITDSTGSTLIKQAVVFEAQTGGNIILFGPTDVDTVNVVIEEAGHED